MVRREEGESKHASLHPSPPSFPCTGLRSCCQQEDDHEEGGCFRLSPTCGTMRPWPKGPSCWGAFPEQRPLLSHHIRLSQGQYTNSECSKAEVDLPI